MSPLFRSRTRLEVLPSALGDCASLRKLIVSGNRLTQLDGSILRLPVLEELWAGDNRLSAIPTSEAWGASLKTLYLHGNPIGKRGGAADSGLPPDHVQLWL
jgi:Leucine-rich repeat (LRR) protein